MTSAVLPSVAAVPVDELVPWLSTQGVQLTGPVRAELISGGRSNLTYALSSPGGSRVVLRRPPFGGVLETAHDMGREWRFIRALHGTEVPVAQPLAFADATGVLGVPFYVMSFVDGLVLHDARAAGELSPAAREASAAALIDTMAALHTVDIDAVGLGGVAKREDYIGRQLRRWRRQWEQSICADIEEVDEAHRLLEQAIPPQERTAIVHGDFRLGNMICAPNGQIRAVLDWELATLGDPLADLGWLLSSWVESGESTTTTTEEAPPSVVDGFPSREWLVRRYAERSGADLSRIGFYVAFSHWRGACISAGVLTRYESRAMGDDGFESRSLRAAVTNRAVAALEMLEHA